MNYFEDGGVLPSSVPRSTRQRPGQEHRSMFGIYRGVVLQTVYPDDKQNSNGQRTEYIVKVRGQKYPNAIIVSDVAGGGIFNYKETILKNSEKSFEKKLEDATYDENLDGEFVYVMFLEGHGNIPLIIGSDTHPKHQEYKPHVKADGRFDIREFNGLEFLIDKDSNYTIKHVGRKDPEGKVLNEAGVDAFWKIFENGDFEWNNHGTEGTADLRMKFTKAERKVEIYAQENKVIMDATGIRIEDLTGNFIQMKPAGIDESVRGVKAFDSDGDRTENVGGNLNQTIGAAWSINISGAADVTTGGATTVNSGGTASVTAPTIELNGASGDVLTTTTDPVIDLITGAPTTGVPTVKAG